MSTPLNDAQVEKVVDRVTAHVADVRDDNVRALAEENRRLKEALELSRKKMGFENLTREQTQQLLDFFMYRLDPDMREKLAATLPVAYNAWCGFDVVQVTSVSDTSRLWTAE